MANTSLQLALKNETTSNTVFAYVTGQAIQNNYAIFLLKSDGTYYYPSNPASIGTPLRANCAISLGGPGSTRTVTIPQIAGGRIWFSIGTPLTFLLNPGPALVEPSVTNNSDPNINTFWDFCELTFNSSQLFANISYVDFVSIPIALSVTSSTGAVQTVKGIPANGLTTVCNGLIAQTATDRRPWSSLIVKNSAGQNLRALSPNNGLVRGLNFTGYFEPFVAQVFTRFNGVDLGVDTQAGYGIVSGRSSGNMLSLSGQVFQEPSTADIFSCSTGPFATGSNQERNTIIPRLAAAFNRSTLLLTTEIPAPAGLYYKQSITNHYARIVHAANVDGLGYSFPYDDVTPDGGQNQAGVVSSGNPSLFTITVGGGQYSGQKRKSFHFLTTVDPGTESTEPFEYAGANGSAAQTRVGAGEKAAQNAGAIQKPTEAIQKPTEVVQKPTEAVQKPTESVQKPQEPEALQSPAAAQRLPETVRSPAAVPTPEAGQRTIGAPTTEGEEAAKNKAEAASTGPTATPTSTPPAPGPQPKKPGLLKRVFRRVSRRA